MNRTNAARGGKKGAAFVRRLLKGVKEAVFFIYLYCGYVQARDFVLACCGRSRLVVLYYHRIGEGDVLTKTAAAFRDELAYLKRHYECISFGELCERMSAKQATRRRAVCITFDDGYRDNFTAAAPALRDAAIPATFFVATGFIGTARDFPHDVRDADGGNVRRFAKLTWDDLREMQAQGFEIGSHTINHTNLGKAARQVIIEEEVSASLETLNRELGERARAFSFPWGKPEDISKYAIEVAKQAGYYAVASAYGGANRRGADVFNVRRVDVGNGEMSRLAVRARIAGFDTDYYRLKLKKWDV